MSTSEDGEEGGGDGTCTMAPLTDGGGMGRPRTAGTVAIGYGLASLVFWLVGWGLGSPMSNTRPEVYVFAQLLLGPLAFPLNLGSGIADGALQAVWVVFYLAATALLALGVYLFSRRATVARAGALLLAILVWLGSGFLNFVLQLRGL
jgi:hypothetical protein